MGPGKYGDSVARRRGQECAKQGLKGEEESGVREVHCNLLRFENSSTLQFRKNATNALSEKQKNQKEKY